MRYSEGTRTNVLSALRWITTRLSRQNRSLKQLQIKAVVVSVLTVYCDDQSSNPAGVYNFYCIKMFEKNEDKRKRGQEWVINMFSILLISELTKALST